MLVAFLLACLDEELGDEVRFDLEYDQLGNEVGRDTEKLVD
jgi:hypothetical protein